jgi:hypothetical protein
VGEPDCILPSALSTTSMRLLSLLLLGALGIAQHSHAQSSLQPPSHEALLAGLTERCLEQAINDHRAFRFRAQGATDHVASPLVARWTAQDLTVYLEPSEAPVPLLVVTTDRSAVTLHRADRRTVRREVVVDLTWWLSSAGGDVLDTQTCRDAASDRLSRKQARALAVEGSPIFDPGLPARSWVWAGMERTMEPVILLGATAIGTYLFFNLRSRRSDTG